MIASPVITPAGGANHHIEVLAVIPANVPGSMTAAVMAFLLGIIHSVAHCGPIVALLAGLLFPARPIVSCAPDRRSHQATAGSPLVIPFTLHGRNPSN
ncbi:hypothetical protein KAT72_15165 [Aeromonas popoffii]|uniref:Uncharacterized protein n=1 Tax=Aeromonas popoffii TaxID=70856 RepID=A0ABS5GT54_9GAMM|nr:hypothetical protein [Aeromonas popoffii]MBR7630321.1 hypothetical protein [Aeromonas popoffii]